MSSAEQNIPSRTFIMHRRSPVFGVAFALALSTAMWLYFDRVLAPHQRVDAAVKHSPRGNLSDLYPRWLGSRELLLHHRDPYSKEIAREIQAGMVWVNSYKVVHPGSPFGGVGESGYGREMGFEVMREYTQPKSVWVNVDAQIPPYYPR